MNEELRVRKVPVTDGVVTQYVDTYTLAEFDLVHGTAATGNATASDVAAGKTFSSATLNGATGTSTKNATVPNDAPILPAQAFVDNIQLLKKFRNSAGLDLSNKGITHFDSTLLYDGQSSPVLLSDSFFPTANKGGWNDGVDLSSNLLPSSDIDALLAAAALYCNDFSASPVIDLSGGANASPSSVADTNLWTMYFDFNADPSVNFHGVAVHLFFVDIRLNGNHFTAAEVNQLLAFFVSSYLSAAKTLDLSGGTSSAPTGQGLTDKAALEGSGWTVTTN